MSIPKKGSRIVVHGDSRYRWYVRNAPTYSQGLAESSMSVAIERVGDERGTVLVVDLRVSRPDNWIAPHQTALKPAEVRAIIAEAIEAGWKPEAAGAAFTMARGLIRDRA